MYRLALVALAPALCLAACGGGATSTNDLASAAMDLAAGADLTAPLDLAIARDLAVAPDLDAYPPGPYGSNVGDTLAPLAWEGYLNPSAMGIATSAPYAKLSLDDLRRSGNKFALVYAADDF